MHSFFLLFSSFFFLYCYVSFYRLISISFFLFPRFMERFPLSLVGGNTGTKNTRGPSAMGYNARGSGDGGETGSI